METFVVRVWAPADESERTVTPAEVLGRVEHVTSGRDWTFRGVDELGRLIHAEVSVMREPTSAGPTGNARAASRELAGEG